MSLSHRTECIYKFTHFLNNAWFVNCMRVCVRNTIRLLGVLLQTSFTSSDAWERWIRNSSIAHHERVLHLPNRIQHRLCRRNYSLQFEVVHASNFSAKFLVYFLQCMQTCINTLCRLCKRHLQSDLDLETRWRLHVILLFILTIISVKTHSYSFQFLIIMIIFYNKKCKETNETLPYILKVVRCQNLIKRGIFHHIQRFLSFLLQQNSIGDYWFSTNTSAKT